MILTLSVVNGGKVLDRVKVDGDRVFYETGKARELVESKARSTDLTPAGAVTEKLAGWSNGYLAFKSDDSAAAAMPARSFLAALDRSGDPSDEDIARWARAAGTDIHPGGEGLKHYWTKGEGLALWADSPHPWTALYDHLITKIKNPEKTARIVSAWYQIVFHGPVGWKKGTNPNGPG